jgi:hypothetical protein
MLEDLQDKSGPFHGEAAPAGKTVRHFRQILLWPVYLLPRQDGSHAHDHAAQLVRSGSDSPWRDLADEFTEDPAEFQERHYREFVTFLPAVQRFLYGHGPGRLPGSGASFEGRPVKIRRRYDVQTARVTLEPGDAPIVLSVAHVDLYFFLGVDIAILSVELFGDDLPFDTAQELICRVGRAYPAGWTEDGRAENCPFLVEWLSASGERLAASDYDNREKYLAFVCQRRNPAVASHWEHLMRPMVLPHSSLEGTLRYRQLEYSQMPTMAFLAMDDPHNLMRADFVRLAYATGPGDSEQLPFAERHLSDFEKRLCYDRYDKDGSGKEFLSARYMSSGLTFVVTGDAGNPVFVDAERGYLGGFRHEHFLLFMIAHFHKAALLMFSDRLTEMVNILGEPDRETFLAFRSGIRHALGALLRFTHRYWFVEVSTQELARDLFALCRRPLAVDRLYEEIRLEVEEMNQYLENDGLRRQNNTIVRLTVVTTFGLIGTVSTGFLGMNLFAWAELSPMDKLLAFLLVLVPSVGLTFYAVLKSRRLSEFLEILADEKVGAAAKFRALKGVWSRAPMSPAPVERVAQDRRVASR